MLLLAVTAVAVGSSGGPTLFQRAVVQAAPRPRDDRDAVTHHRLVVRLERPCLVRYQGTIPGIPQAPRDSRGKIDLRSAEAQAYLGLLTREQGAVWQELVRRVPDAKRHYTYQILFNGLVVKVPHDAVDEVRGINGVSEVRSTDRVVYKPSLDTSLDLIDAPVFWDSVGGVGYAGRDVKVAVIDSGIDVDNPMFDPTGFSYPLGFPKGATTYTTRKVIAARAYFRPDDPVDLSRDEPNPSDHGGHGSHCAGIIAGSPGTVFDLGGVQLEVNGVAPAAYLMSYKVFYSAESGTDGATEPELMAAFEDAVADGADVISNSWGGPDVFGPYDPSLEVYANAIEAGCVVVFAAGNEGPGDGSMASPGIYGPFLTVGATSTGRQFTNYLDITGPEPVPNHLQGVVMSIGRISASLGDGVGPAPFKSSALVDGGANETGCSGFTPGAFDASVAMVLRGDCPFTQKVENAAAAGAVAVVVRNHNAGEGAFAMQGDDVSVPAVMVSYEDGDRLGDWAAAHSDAEIYLSSGLVPYNVPSEVGLMADFSSRGPTAWAGLKPEVVAPGTLILSADAHSVSSSSTRPWGLKGGTSMACPHVAGVSALLKAEHPSWTHHEIKSAIVGTASPEGIRSNNMSVQAGAWERGSGQVSLSRLLEMGLMASPPVLNLGEVRESETATALLTITRHQGDAAQVAVVWEGGEWPEGVTVTPAHGDLITLSPQGPTEVEFSFTVEPGQGVEPVDFTGHLELADNTGGITRVPYSVRVVPQVREVDLLLVDLTFYAENEGGDVLPIYEAAAERAGLTYETARDTYSTSTAAVPPLPELMRYHTLVLITGDDMWYHFSDFGVRTLDRVCGYTLRGGGLLVMGQGPLRSSRHVRTSALLGAIVEPGLPLYDEGSGGLVSLSEYRVFQVDKPRLVTEDLQLGNNPLGGGDLRLLGEVFGAVGGELEEGAKPWSRAVLRMSQGPFVGMGDVAVAYDPYSQYGEDPLAEAHTHRGILLGFGLEVIEEPDDPTGPSGPPAPGSRAELLANAHRWVSERVALDVHVARTDLDVTFTAEAQPVHGTVEEYFFDFGDGSEPVTSADAVVEHRYDAYGTYPLVAYAWSDLGAVGAYRADIYVAPGSQGVDAGVADAGDPMDDGGLSPDASAVISPSGGGCRCAAVGAPRLGGMSGGMSKRGDTDGSSPRSGFGSTPPSLPPILLLTLALSLGVRFGRR